MAASRWTHTRRAAPLCAALVILFSSLALAAPAPLPEADLAPAIERAMAKPALRRALCGVLVESLRDGRVLYSLNAGRAFMPASNQKIVTAALGLTHLGTDYRFRTELHATGKTRRDALEGDLYLRGLGDPTLTTDALQEFVAAVRERGIRRIRGSVVVDDTFFSGPRIPRGWSYDYLQDYYAMPVCALSVNGNVVAFVAEPGAKEGRLALITWTPMVLYFGVRNETLTGKAGAKTSLSVSRALGTNTFVVRGTIARDAKPTRLEAITIEDPALYCGHALRELLAAAKIRVEGDIRRGTLPDGASLLRQRLSAPLSEILPDFLKPSDNHFGEQIIRTVAAEVGARARAGGSPAGNAPNPTPEAVASRLLAAIGGDPDSIRAVDGSGLSRLNLVTPEALVRILRHARTQPWGDVFVQALPVAGTDGTLARRLRDTPAAGSVRAKTGTVNAVSCLSGYATTAGGEPVVFSVLMNHFAGDSGDARAAQDEIAVLLARLRR